MLLAILLASGFSLRAQIAATLHTQPDGSAEIRLRNDSSVSLTAFAISVNYVDKLSANNDPAILYVDPEIDVLLVDDNHPDRRATGPLLPGKEFTWLPYRGVRTLYQAGKPVFQQPVAIAGIFEDGATTGNPGLLTRLMLRRSNMLLAVETTMETLAEAGNRNVPRDQLIRQFRRLADSLNRWYVPREQQVGRGLYQSIVGKLINLPDGPVGSPFPPSTFVEEETAQLNRHRVTLRESQPSLADLARIGTR